MLLARGDQTRVPQPVKSMMARFWQWVLPAKHQTPVAAGPLLSGKLFPHLHHSNNNNNPTCTFLTREGPSLLIKSSRVK